MSGFDLIDEAARAGARAENADFASPAGTAGINPLKFAKRPIYIPAHLGQLVVSGSITSSLSGVFPGRLMPNSGASYMLLGLLSPKTEVSPGEPGTLHIYWTTAATSGNLRLVVDIRPIINGAASLASAVQRSIITAANASTNVLEESKILFPPAILSNNQGISVKIARDPSNSLDTLSDDIVIRAVYLEILGRC